MKNIVRCLLTIACLSVVFFGFASSARADIQATPPYDYLWSNATVGPGSIVVLAEFGLTQASGSDTLDKVGCYLSASTTMTQGEISRISLWRESGVNWGFQPDEDTFLAGAASTSPNVGGALITLDPTSAVAIPNSQTKFYVVASTTSTAGITNGHGFDFSMDANWASTTAGSGTGEAFVPAHKYTLEQSPNIKISEVKLGSTSNAQDEFIELYNTSNFAIDLKDAGLSLNIYNAAGSSTPKTLTYFNTVIPAHGYFLVGSETNYSGSVALDASYVTLTGNTLISNGGFSIATSTIGASATSTAIDRLAWGTQPDANAETAATTTDLAVDYSFERKATTTSTNTSMLTPSGSEAYKGNGHDSGDNRVDFILRTAPEPQNSHSNEEVPFGGDEFGETLAPRVMGSYPSDNMTNVPPDMTFVGFGFTKPVNSETVNTINVTLTPTSGGSNLCTTVTYDPAGMPQGRCNFSSLSGSTSYTFRVSTSVADFGGVALDQDAGTVGDQAYTATFVTGGGAASGGGTLTDMTPPHVMGTLPFPGAGNVPANIDKFFVQFDRSMNTSTLDTTNIILRQGNETGTVVSTGLTSFNATTSVLTVDVSSVTFAANTHYVLMVDGDVQSSNGAQMGPPYYAHFDTSSNDVSAPAVLGTMPVTGGATNVGLNKITTIFMLDDYLDMSTATSGAVTLIDTVTSVPVPGTVSYDPVMKELSFTANNALPSGRDLRFTLVGASLKNISGVALGTDYTLDFSTEATNSDTTGPTVMMVNADNFGLSVSFDEAVKETDAETLTNYSITVGGSAFTLSSMAGQSIVYNTERRAAEFQNVNFPPSSTIAVTVSGVRDISNNLMTSQTVQATVMSFADSGGFLGPGQATGNFGPSAGQSFDMGGGMGGFMPGLNVMPFNAFKSASSTYGFEMPIETQIPANGQIVISFPQTSDYGLSCVATTSSNYFGMGNKDINGPGTGTVGIKTISGSNTAKTVTLTLDTATRAVGTDQHDFLHFDVLDIKNPSVPKGPDSGGYAVTVTTKDASGNTIKTFNSFAVFINGGNFGGNGTTTIRGRVLSAYDGTTGLNGVDVILGSPMTGPQRTTTAANGYGGGAAGEFQFTDLPVGFDFNLFTPDSIVDPTATTTNYFGATQPMMIRATSTSIQYNNLSLTATTLAQTFTVKATAAAGIFTASEKIDIWAGGPGQFTGQTYTPGTGALTATTIATLSLPQTNGMWNIGVGPAMPKDGMFMGPPPTPEGWIEPKPIMVQMSGCPGACLTTIDGVVATSYTFTVSAADKTITGILKDGSANRISQGEVFAYSPSGMTGTHAQTGTDGTFTLRVTSGTYQVGAFFPGMGNTREVSVEVAAAGNYVDGALVTGTTGANPFILTMKRPAYTITGRVTDGTSAVPNAPVFAYRTNGPGHADAMTNSSGNYTLYVDSGTWNIGCNIPGYGPVSEVSQTVGTANIENVNFRPTLGVSYYDVLGTVFEDANGDSSIDSGEGISGVMIDIKSSTGMFYHTGTGSDGTYTVRVPAGTGYRMELFRPNYGRIPAEGANGVALGSFNVAATTTKNVKLASRKTVTINVRDVSDNLINVPEMFIDFYDQARDFGNHVEIRNASSTTMQIANASTTVRAYMPSVPQSAISVASDNASTFVVNGILGIDGNETIKIVVNTNLNTITGTLADGNGSALTDVWVELIDTSNGMHFGEYATTSTFVIKAGNGTYKIVGMKPRYTMTPQTLVVDGNETAALVLTSANLTISGTITAGGSVAENAFVRAEKVGGGFVATQADANGVYTLNVDSGTWRIFAASHKYVEAGYASNPLVVSSSQTGINIALTSAASINDNMATSPTFTDTEAGTFRDETVNVNVSLDANALGTAGSTAYMTAQETVNYVNTPSVNVVGSKAKEIKAYAGGTQVTQLESGKKAQVELTYTTTELGTVDTPSEVNDLRVAAWSDTLQEWESLATTPIYKDSSGNVVEIASDATAIPGTVTQVTFKTTEATHFSPYALISATDPGAPDTPSGLSATASSNQIALSWTAVSTAAGYYIYRDTSSGGSFALLTSTTGTSYTNTGLSFSTTYYYKVAAYKSGGASESASSGAVSATTQISGGGGIMGGGGGGGSSVPTPVYTVVPGTDVSVTEETPTVTSTASEVVQPSAVAQIVSPVFNTTLKYGMTSDDIKRMQELLASDSEIYPEGIISGWFGSLTKKAVQRFQKKYGIVSSGSEETTGYGLVGPSTRAKLQEVFAQAAPAAPAVAQPSATAVSVSPVFNSGISKGASNSDVKRLQQLLNSDPDTQIASSGVGSPGNETNYFGTLTEKAVQKFQEKYSIAKKGDAGYGYVGPITRTKLQEVFSNQTTTQTQTTTETTDTSALEAQVQTLMQQLEVLQAELNAVQ